MTSTTRFQRGLRAAILGLAATGALLAGCSSSPIPVAPLQPIKSEFSLHVKWKESLGGKDNALLDPLMSGNSLYVATEKGELMAMDPDTGSTQWKVKTGEGLSAGIGSGDEHLLLGTKRGELLAYDMKGRLAWRAQLSSELMVPPQAADGVTVAFTADGHLYGLDSSDGKRLWQLTRPMPALLLRGLSGISMARGAAFIGLPAGKLLALTSKDGKVGWETTVSLPRGATELERVNDVVGPPILGAREICTATYQGKVACLDASTGAALWTRDIASTGNIAASGNRIFMADEKGNVHALSRATGTSAWKADSLQGRYLSAPALLDDYVVVGDIGGVVHFMSRVDGVEVARVTTDDTPILKQPVAMNGNGVLVQTRKGRLYAISP
jgi:outer membrane protein assembly factor BamB